MPAKHLQNECQHTDCELWETPVGRIMVKLSPIWVLTYANYIPKVVGAKSRNFLFASVLANILPLYKRINPKNKATHRHVIACVCIVVNPSCKYFTPIQTHQSTKTKQRIVMSCHCVRLYCCKPILQIFYPYTNAPIHKNKATNRHVIACVCIVVNPSCKYFTYIFYLYTNAPIHKNKATHRHVIACVCIVVKPSCKYFTYIQTHQSTKTKQRIVVSLRAFVLL